jgi:hypothetical protein
VGISEGMCNPVSWLADGSATQASTTFGLDLNPPMFTSHPLS